MQHRNVHSQHFTVSAWVIYIFLQPFLFSKLHDFIYPRFLCYFHGFNNLSYPSVLGVLLVSTGGYPTEVLHYIVCAPYIQREKYFFIIIPSTALFLYRGIWFLSNVRNNTNYWESQSETSLIVDFSVQLLYVGMISRKQTLTTIYDLTLSFKFYLLKL